MSFHVGQKVVCVDASPPMGGWDMPFPYAKGQILVVTAVDLCAPPCPGCLELNGDRWHWESTRFRPLTERKTDISQFVTLLDPANHYKLEEV